MSFHLWLLCLEDLPRNFEWYQQIALALFINESYYKIYTVGLLK